MVKANYSMEIDVVDGPHGGACKGNVIRKLKFVRVGTYEEISKRCTSCNQVFKRELEYAGD